MSERGRNFGLGMFFVVFWLVFTILVDHYVLGGGNLLFPLEELVEEEVDYGICEHNH